MEYIISQEELNNILYVSAVENDRCVGRLNFQIDDNISYIKYIYVDEDYRQQGIGSGLLKELSEYVRVNLLEGTIFAEPVDKNQKAVVERFFIKNNFYMPAYDGRIVVADIDKLKNSYIKELSCDINEIEDRLYKMNKLPMELKTYFEKNIKNNIEQGYLPENVLGEMIPELSFALEKDGQISSYVIFSEYDGDLYLSSTYVDGKNLAELISLLTYCFKLVREKYNKYEKIKIRTVNYEGYNLFKKLIEGAYVSHDIVLVTYRFF